jgi:hypothetical protein
VSHALLDIAAAMERVHKIVEQGEFLRTAYFWNNHMDTIIRVLLVDSIDTIK